MKPTNQPSRNLTFVGMMIALVGVFIAILLVCKHDFSSVSICKSSFGCTIDGVDGCSELGKSGRSKMPFVPVSFASLGLAYYLFLLILFWRLSAETDGARRGGLQIILLTLAVMGLVVDLALAYINFFELIVPCRLCMYTYGVTLGILVVAILLQKQSKESEGTFMDGIKASLLPAGGSLGGVLLVFFVLFLASGGGAEGNGKFALLPEEKVKRRLTEFRTLNPVDLSEKGLDSVEGSKDAYIVVHKFADFRCPHCLHASNILSSGLRRWPGRIKIYYRHFPLDGTCNPEVSRKQPGAWSCNGTQAALCAPEQDIFAKFYHGVFNFQRSETQITLPALKRLAEDLGGDWSRMQACMGTRKTAKKLERDIDDAMALKISSTPTITLQGRLLPAGTPDPTYFFQTLDALVFEKEGAAAYEEFQKRKKAGGVQVQLPEGAGHGHDHGHAH